MRSVFVATISLLLVTLCLMLLAPLAFGQGANATITGTVTDPTGLAIAAATVEARNTETGAVYTAASTNAGNYAITNLPVGTYELTAKVSGFKTYAHPNLAIAAAQVLKEDIPLQVGETSESITVEAQASLLKTETGEQGDNVTVEQMLDSPLLGIGTVNSGTSGVRNPYNVLQTLPGVTGYAAGGTVGGPMVVNGLGGANGFNVSLPRRCASRARTPLLRSSGTTFTRRWPSRTRMPFRKSLSRPATTPPRSDRRALRSST